MFSHIKTYFAPEPLHSEEDSSYLIVPDLHGVYSLYQKVEFYIKNEIEDHRVIIFLGDYMDRGESGTLDGEIFKDLGSYLVIRDLIKLRKWAKENDRRIIFLRGNHEVFFEDYFLHDDKYAYKEYGFFKNSVDCLEFFFQKDATFYQDFMDFFENLEAYHLNEKINYLFIHAGIDPDEKDIDKQVEDGLVYWIRDKFLFSEKKLHYTVVFGHTPFSKPFMRADKIGLDSGVYKRGFINLLEVDHGDSKIIQLYKEK